MTELDKVAYRLMVEHPCGITAGQLQRECPAGFDTSKVLRRMMEIAQAERDAELLFEAKS